jgi:16S rRNA (cytidine1402-2'-O)-methyltransferase
VQPALYLVPNFIGVFSKEYLPQRTLENVYRLKHFIVEREKTARAFLKAINHPTPQNEFEFIELDKHNNYAGFKSFFDQNISNSIGVLSEAGLPAIADPGSEVVKYAHLNKIKVVPLAGSSSIFLALMASGMDGQNFAFHGYLPIDARERVKSLKDIELKSRKASQIFMEAPYRNNQFLDFLIKNLQNDTTLCIAADLETDREIIISKKVQDWETKLVDLHKRPTIYIIKG